MDARSKVALKKQRGSIGTPWTTQHHIRNAFGKGEATSVEDIAIRPIGRRRGSGDVTATLAVDSAPLKPGSRGSEDKVGGPFNITLLETETGSRTSEEKGILIAENGSLQNKSGRLPYGVPRLAPTEGHR